MAATKRPPTRKNGAKTPTKSKPTKAVPKNAPKRSAKVKAASAPVASTVLPAKSQVKSKGKRTALVSLSTRERRQLLKPRPDFAEIMKQIERTWAAERTLKVPSITAKTLKKLRQKALRAIQREAVIRAECEKKMRLFADARLIAEDAAYRAILTVYAAVKLYRQSNAQIGKQFAFIGEHLTAARAASEPVRQNELK